MREQILKTIEKNSRISMKELAILLGKEEICTNNPEPFSIYKISL